MEALINEDALKKISAELNISLSYLKKILEEPSGSCDVLTVEEARKAFFEAPPGSGFQKSALARWNELSLEAVERASNAEKAREAYDNAPCDSEAKKAALRKLYVLYICMATD